jgi:O-antigen ligase
MDFKIKTAGAFWSKLRLFSLVFFAFSVGLGIAVTSVAKSLVLLVGLVSLVNALINSLRARTSQNSAHAHTALRWTPIAILLGLAALALTLAWTPVPLDEALSAWIKHSKLLMIPLMVLLIRSWREAKTVLMAYLAAQVLLLVSSWLLVLHVPVPWATSDTALTDYTVFSSYLDQSIMTCVVAAICWHLLPLVPGRRWRAAAYVVIALGLCSTVFVMQGRTGHLVAVAMVSLSIMWRLPMRYRILALMTPAVLMAVLVACSPVMYERFSSAYGEITAFTQQANNRSSSGERLNYWQRSIEAITERPLTGHGVGSWSAQYLRLDQGRGNPPTFNIRNPHQEFLLWGVEAGLAGCLLLMLVFLAMFADARRLPPPVARAAQSVLVALFICCLFNSALFDGKIGDFFCVTTGVLLALGLRQHVLPARPKPRLAADASLIPP